MMWATFNSTLRRLVVGGCCIHMFQDEYSFNDKIESEVKECGPPTEGQWNVCDSELITLYQRTQAIPGSDLSLIELMWRVLYDKFAASNFVWISCGGWWILYKSWFPNRAYFTWLCWMKSGKITRIPGGANPRFTLCEDETTTRGCGSSAL